MIKLRLYKSESAFIGTYLNFFLPEPIENNRELYTYLLEEREVEQLLDSLVYALCEKGLDGNDEPNQIGYQIESLIDRVHETIA